jgi:hypothetical protein
VGGVEEVVAEARHGRLAQAGDDTALADNILQILQARGSLPGATVHRGEALPQEFHIREMVKQYESLYDRLLHTRHEADGARSCATVTKL